MQQWEGRFGGLPDLRSPILTVAAAGPDPPGVTASSLPCLSMRPVILGAPLTGIATFCH